MKGVCDFMKTVKAKIAAAVDSDGSWAVFGGSLYDGGEKAMKRAEENLGPMPSRFWLEVDLPVPEKGEVDVIFVESVSREVPICC